MPLIQNPTRIAAAGTPPKLIAEFIGCVNTSEKGLSIAEMRSPAGWSEPGQTPEFDEYTIVLEGSVRVEMRSGVTDVAGGQAYVAAAGEWVRYSSPSEGGAHYIAVCVPAFTLERAHRDNE